MYPLITSLFKSLQYMCWTNGFSVPKWEPEIPRPTTGWMVLKPCKYIMGKKNYHSLSWWVYRISGCHPQYHRRPPNLHQIHPDLSHDFTGNSCFCVPSLSKPVEFTLPKTNSEKNALRLENRPKSERKRCRKSNPGTHPFSDASPVSFWVLYLSRMSLTSSLLRLFGIEPKWTNYQLYTTSSKRGL